MVTADEPSVAGAGVVLSRNYITAERVLFFFFFVNKFGGWKARRLHAYYKNIVDVRAPNTEGFPDRRPSAEIEMRGIAVCERARLYQCRNRYFLAQNVSIGSTSIDYNKIHTCTKKTNKNKRRGIIIIIFTYITSI